MSFESESVNASDNKSPGELPPTSPGFPADIQQAAEHRVAHRLRHVTTEALTIAAVRRLAIRRTAERLVHESRSHGLIKPH
ncbi:MAG: hypothetical protein H7X97_03910 [Opitutaceae bacterium]|nr:hypothetical protein [Verrucomicrobiales bacterium]